MSNFVLPQRQQPTRLLHPWDSPGRILEWVAISFSNAWKWKVKVKSFSRVQLWATPWTTAYHRIFQTRVLEWGAIAFSKQTHHKITNWNCNQKYSSKQKPRSRQLHSWILPKIQRRSNWNKDCQRNINNLRYADDTTLMAESEEELKASWWKWKWRVKKLA